MKKFAVTLSVWSVVLLLIGIGTTGSAANLDHAKSELENSINNQTSQQEDIRKVVYDQLPEEHQTWITAWDEATTRDFVADPEFCQLFNGSFANKNVIAVDYTLDVSHMPNNIIILAAPETGEVIGMGLVD